MPERPETPPADAADPWLRAALQRPAGPVDGAAEPGEAPVSSDRVAEPAVEAEAPATASSVEPPAAEPRVDPSVVRRLAVQALYVLGGDPDAPRERLLEALDEPFDDEDEPDGGADHPDAAKEAAVDLAAAAWAGHAAADAAVVAQVPAWPTIRQPPVDRAILRLGHHELVTQRAPFAVVINEAVELAKAFGEDRTPGFVNAVLDALARGDTAKPAPAGDTGDVKRATGERPASGAAEARRGKRERFNKRKAEMAAKIGPKHPRPEPPKPGPEPTEATPPAEQPPDAPETPADPWAAAAQRRGDEKDA